MQLTGAPPPCVSFLRITGTGNSLSGHMTNESVAYAQAAMLLDSVVTQIRSCEVNVECIDTITRNRKNFEALVNCYYDQPNATTDVDCADILWRTEKLACDVAQFEKTRRDLQILCKRCSLEMPPHGKGTG